MLSGGTTYDALGRVATSSNPADGSVAKDTYAYDVLSRISSVTHHADGNVAKMYYGSAVGTPGGLTSQACATGTYGVGYPSLAADETGRLREMWTDALGNLIEVDEPNASSGSLSGGQATCYSYDVLGDLTGVSQPTPARTRSYTYDGLSRLTSATTPESGATNYYYTTSGGGLCSGDPAAVCRRTDARPVTTTYTYDALNRVLNKNYSDGTSTAHYYYDEASKWGVSITNPVGRLTSSSTNSSYVANIFSYDAMGRVVKSWPCTYINCGYGSFPFTLGYDLAGDRTSVAYTSGRTVTYGYNSAQQVISAADNTGINYAANATYFPTGGLASLQNGASLVSTMYYNNRLQPCRISVASSGTPPSQCSDSAHIGNVLDFTYGFNSASGDNGNVMAVTNNLTAGRSQAFTYDALNRLASGKTQATSGSACWGLNYAYDAWGNMTSTAMSGYSSCNQVLFGTQADSNNRVQWCPSPPCYDAAGNMKHDMQHAYTYDAENELSTVDTTAATYYFDAQGQRVEKVGGSNYSYVYGPNGEVLAEYIKGSGGNGSVSLVNEYVYFGGQRIARRDSFNNVTYTYADGLGSSRIITNPSGTVCYDSDFQSFGAEVNFANTCGLNYKFTGQERDSESGNDHYWARYFGVTTYQNGGQQYAMGRWMSPDPLGGDITNPQSLNRYAYALNNPTTLTDPTGLCSDYDYTYTITDPETGQTTIGFHVDSGPCPPEPPTLGCANMDGYGCGYNGPNYAYTGGAATSGGGGAGSGTSMPPPPGPPPPPNAPPVTLTCLGTATFSDVSQSQMNRLLTNGPGGALAPGIVPTSGTVAIGGSRTFGLTKTQLKQFGPYITVNPTDLSGTISAMGGPSPPYTVSDIGDVNIRNSAGTRYDIYAFPDNTANDFGIQKSNATVTVIPWVYSAHCPSGSSLISGPPQ